MQKVKTGVQKYLIVIVLLFNIALQIISRLFKFGLQNAITPEFLVDCFISTVTSILCFISFIPFGNADEMKRSSTFANIVAKWSELTNKVREGMLQLFQKFCRTQVDRERVETKKFILANNTVIEYDEYVEKYEGKSKSELKECLKLGQISNEEYKALCKCNRVKIKPINALSVLNGAKKTSVNDAGRDDSNYAISKTLQRLIVILALSFIINSITTTFTGGGENVLLDIMLATLSIVNASVCGYTTGVNNFRHNEDKIKARVMFLSLFLEEQNNTI